MERAAFVWLVVAWLIRLLVILWLPTLAAVLLFFAHSDEKTYENFARCTSEAENSLARDTLAGTMSNDKKVSGYLLVQIQDQTRQCMIGLGCDLDQGKCSTGSHRRSLQHAPARGITCSALKRSLT